MKLLLTAFGFILATQSIAAEDCVNDLEQDLNCNFIDVSEESDVDLSDATCASTVDDEGNPFPNADYYYDYTSFDASIRCRTMTKT